MQTVVMIAKKMQQYLLVLFFFMFDPVFTKYAKEVTKI